MPTLISRTRPVYERLVKVYMTDRLINILTSAFFDFKCILSKVHLFASLHTLQNVSYFYPFIMNTLLLLAWINL